MKVCTSIDVESLYYDNGGSKYSRKNLVKKVVEYFDDEIVALQSSGIATLLVFHQHASTSKTSR